MLSEKIGDCSIGQILPNAFSFWKLKRRVGCLFTAAELFSRVFH